jgi:hypothetical protein
LEPIGSECSIRRVLNLCRSAWTRRPESRSSPHARPTDPDSRMPGGTRTSRHRTRSRADTSRAFSTCRVRGRGLSSPALQAGAAHSVPRRHPMPELLNHRRTTRGNPSLMKTSATCLRPGFWASQAPRCPMSWCGIRTRRSGWTPGRRQPRMSAPVLVPGGPGAVVRRPITGRIFAVDLPTVGEGADPGNGRGAFSSCPAAMIYGQCHRPSWRSHARGDAR